MKDVKSWLRPFLTFKGSPHQLALSFGLGVALGVLPGTGALVAAAFGAALRLNVPLMMAGALLTNPVTVPFLYAGSYFLGEWFLGSWLPAGLIARIALGTITGSLFLAVALGLIAYGVVFSLTFWMRTRHVASD